MNAATLKLTGVVPVPPPNHNPYLLDLREALAENDRLILQNQALKRERDQALDRVAQLEALHRTWGAAEIATLPCAYHPPMLVVGKLRLNYPAQRLEHGGRSVYLPLRPMELLSYLMSRPGQVVSSGVLAQALGFNHAHSARELVRKTRCILAGIGARDYLCSSGLGRIGYWVARPEEQP